MQGLLSFTSLFESLQVDGISNIPQVVMAKIWVLTMAVGVSYTHGCLNANYPGMYAGIHNAS